MSSGEEPDANYFGPANEVMVEPVLEWTRRQLQQGRPFMTAIMTNVGHHPFEPPADWRTIEFDPSIDRRLNNYYNCLRYDGRRAGADRQGLRGTRRAGEHLFPTMVELLGLRMEGGRLPGRSLLQPVEADRTVFFSASIESTYLGMRRGKRKYVYSFERDPIAVYDLARDASETAPLASVSRTELQQARRALIEWKVQAETSAYGHPARSYRPARSWSDTARER